MIVAYIDGAESEKELACGLVLLYKDVQIEHQHKMARTGDIPRGLCEFYALIKLVQLVEQMGVPFEEVAVYSDCQKVTQAQYVLHKENYVRSERQKEMMKSVTFTCEKLIKNPEYVSVLLDFINRARFNWVKGHRNVVYNQRADYLAYTCLVSKDTQRYSKWVGQGFCLWNGATPYAWFPPFSKREEEEKDDTGSDVTGDGSS